MINKEKVEISTLMAGRMEILEIINELVTLGNLIEDKINIDSLYCYGILPINNCDYKAPAQPCIFLLLITTETDSLYNQIIFDKIKFVLDLRASMYLIIHDLRTVNEALINNSRFLHQVINHGLKVWDFSK